VNAHFEALPLASRQLLTSNNVEQVRRHLSSALRPHDIDLGQQRSNMNFIHNQARIGDIALNAMYYGTEVHVKAPESESGYLFMLTLSGYAEVEQGGTHARIDSGTVYVFNPTRNLNVSLSANNRQLVIRLPRENMERFLTNEISRSLTDPLEFETRPFCLSQDVPGLQTFVQSMYHDLDRPNPGYEQRTVAKHVESMLLSLCLSSLSHNYSDVYENAGASVAPYFVRRAEKFMRLNIEESITLQDIANAAGSSGRSLQSGFRNFRGTTPMAYLRDLRLERAHEELLKSTRSNGSVTDIATAFGFMHLSKFAKYYKARFGETPSETARRGWLD
jgi:AraC-like DNA-binding protein